MGFKIKINLQKVFNVSTLSKLLDLLTFSITVSTGWIVVAANSAIHRGKLIEPKNKGAYFAPGPTYQSCSYNRQIVAERNVGPFSILKLFCGLQKDLYMESPVVKRE
jgi:hypothetical protein